MSIANEITRLQQAKADIKTAIEGKGVTVPSDATLDTYDDYIDSIQTGGGGGTTDWESIAKGMLDASTNFEAPSYGIDSSKYYVCAQRLNMTGTATLKSGVTSIAQCAFQKCGITGITIPNTVTSIGHQAFENSKITSLTIPNSVTTMAAYAIRNCSSLASVTLSTALTNIPAGCFAGCSALTSITIPSSVTSFSQEAFMSSGLTSITIPNTVTSIGASAFRTCKSLLSVTLPNAITAINAQTFQGSKITSITIPASVTSIANATFHECTSLQEMIFEGTTPPTLANNSNCIGSTAYSFPIYVPDAAVNTYKTSGNFVAYASRIKGISERTTT